MDFRTLPYTTRTDTYGSPYLALELAKIEYFGPDDPKDDGLGGCRGITAALLIVGILAVGVVACLLM